MIGEIFFNIGSVTVYTYGFFVMIAVLCTSAIIYLLSKKANLQKTVIFDLIIYTLLFGIVGARITYYILYPDQFNSFWGILKIWQGGLVSWGGFILGLAAAITVLKIYRENIFKWIDILSIASLFGLAIGRFGSFLSGELAGTTYKGFLSIRGIHPVTLYESLFLLILFFVWLIIYLRYSSFARAGFFCLGVAASYSLARFVVDFFRQESDLFIGVSLGQLFSAIIFLLTTAMFIIIYLSNKRGPANVIRTND